jgi:ribonuclease HII
VEKYLVEKGHVIFDRNWCNMFCKINIVFKYGDMVYLTEVKYRRNDNQGGGMAAITAKIQQQMVLAAEFYATRRGILSVNLKLAVVDVASVPSKIRDFLELG